VTNFNLYKLNGNYTTEDGIGLVNPTFRVVEVQFYSSFIVTEQFYSISLNWIDSSNDINRALDVNFYTNDFPNVEFVEGQILQIPNFKNATIVN
jgi:hypothetical protein